MGETPNLGRLSDSPYSQSREPNSLSDTARSVEASTFEPPCNPCQIRLELKFRLTA